jgi:hypothetical protein
VNFNATSVRLHLQILLCKNWTKWAKVAKIKKSIYKRD